MVSWIFLGATAKKNTLQEMKDDWENGEQRAKFEPLLHFVTKGRELNSRRSIETISDP